MNLEAKAWIPYGVYWSTPFVRWQRDFSDLHALQFGAWIAARALQDRNVDLTDISCGVLGMTVPQHGSFYGLPWLTGLIGADHVGGPTISQACATGVRCLQVAASDIAAMDAGACLVIAADRTSNGPHVYYPSPGAAGGTGQSEDWVTGNFNFDPYAQCAMLDTAENVALRWNVSKDEQDDVTLLRYSQYDAALADDRSFQRGYMTLPFDVPDKSFTKIVGAIDGDIGVQVVDEVKLRGLRPVREAGTVTYAGQTHPADGSAGLVVASRDLAQSMSRDPAVTVRILGFGQSRHEKGFMPAAPLGAAQRALQAAGVTMAQIDAVKSHNPFVINDIVFARETGFAVERMNNFGCSLVWGHPQGPTGMRGTIELIEELAIRGGGLGLFQGCAAGDTAMALVIHVDVA